MFSHTAPPAAPLSVTAHSTLHSTTICQRVSSYALPVKHPPGGKLPCITPITTSNHHQSNSRLAPWLALTHSRYSYFAVPTRGRALPPSRFKQAHSTVTLGPVPMKPTACLHNPYEPCSGRRPSSQAAANATRPFHCGATTGPVHCVAQGHIHKYTCRGIPNYCITRIITLTAPAVTHVGEST